mgnify:FL=1
MVFFLFCKRRPTRSFEGRVARVAFHHAARQPDGHGRGGLGRRRVDKDATRFVIVGGNALCDGDFIVTNVKFEIHFHVGGGKLRFDSSDLFALHGLKHYLFARSQYQNAVQVVFAFFVGAFAVGAAPIRFGTTAAAAAAAAAAGDGSARGCHESRFLLNVQRTTGTFGRDKFSTH